MKHIAAAFELIAGDSDVGEKDGKRSEYARRLVVAGFKQIGQSELREFPRAWGNEVNEQEAEPSTGRLPQRGIAVFVGIFRTCKQRAGADPRSQQRKHQTIAGSDRPATR